MKSEHLFEAVKKRLESLSYLVKDEDTWIIEFSISKVKNSIMTECNTNDIPKELEFTAVDMICGEFLYAKKQSGSLTDFNLETAVKSIKAGDTDVTFAIGEGTQTPEQRLDKLIVYLITSGKEEFMCYRKVRW